MTTYTRNDLEIAYKAGKEGINLDDLLKVMNWLESKSLTPKAKRGQPAKAATAAKPAKDGRRKRSKVPVSHNVNSFLNAQKKATARQIVDSFPGISAGSVNTHLATLKKDKYIKKAKGNGTPYILIKDIPTKR